MSCRTLCPIVWAVLFAFWGCSDSHSPQEPLGSQFVWAVGNDDLLEGQLNDPSALAIEPSTKNVYILDAGWMHVFSSQGEFLERWSTLPDEPSRGLTFSPEGTLLATDYAHAKVLELTKEGTLIRSWGEEGTEQGQFLGPMSIAVGANGWIYVADSGNHRIQVFDREGGYLSFWGFLGDEIGNMVWPRSIALDGAGNVYICDSGNYRIQKFDALGNWISQWGEWGGASEGGNIGTHITALTMDGADVLVLQRGFNVQRFTADGVFLDSWAGEGTELLVNDIFANVGIATNQEHVNYAIGLKGFGVQVHNSSGILLNTFGKPRGSAPNQFVDPVAVAVANDETIVVGEHSTGRVQRFNKDGASIGEWSSHTYWSVLRDIAVGPDGSVFELRGAPDRHLGVVEIYSASGGVLETLYHFSYASGISIDEQGRMWVADEFEHSVSVYLPGEEGPQTTWGEAGLDAGELWQPACLAARDGIIVVCDSNAITVFDENGVYTRNLTTWDSGEPKYQAVAISEDLTVYASSMTEGKISVFQTSGKFLGDLQPVDPWEPLDVAVGREGDVYALTARSPNLWKLSVN